MAQHLTRSDCEGFNVVDGTDDGCRGMTVKRVGMLGVSVRQM